MLKSKKIIGLLLALCALYGSIIYPTAHKQDDVEKLTVSLQKLVSKKRYSWAFVNDLCGRIGNMLDDVERDELTSMSSLSDIHQILLQYPENASKRYYATISYSEFEKVMDVFAKQTQKIMDVPSCWLDGKHPSLSLYDINNL